MDRALLLIWRGPRDSNYDCSCPTVLWRPLVDVIRTLDWEQNLLAEVVAGAL